MSKPQILVLSGTNRKNSKTEVIAKHCYTYLKEHYEGNVVYLDLTDVENELIHPFMYEKDQLTDKLKEVQDELIVPSKTWLIVSPEYNGGFPGILKLFIDAISMRKYGESFTGKRAAMIGVSSGRAGNLRGMEALTGFLNYLKFTVFPNKLPVSQISHQLNSEKQLNEISASTLHKYLTELIEWQGQ
jgi:chromate reductase, NAD(P)H dehydrogenase (quinone)